MSAAGEGVPNVYATVDVALFTMVGKRELGIVLRQDDDGGTSLPRMALDTSLRIDDQAALVTQTVASCAEAAPPLEPYAWRVGESYGSGRLHLGYAAVAGALTFLPEQGITTVGAKALLDSNEAAPRLMPEEMVVVRAALKSIRGAADLRVRRMPEAKYNAGPIAARLLSDPDRFPLTELQAVFEATTGGKFAYSKFSWDVDNVLSDGVVKIGERSRHTNGPGRPPELYCMVPEQRVIPAASLRPPVSIPMVFSRG